MNEEKNSTVDSSASADLSEVLQELQTVSEALTDSETLEIDGVAKTDMEILAEILEAVSPDVEKVMEQEELVQTEFETLTAIGKGLDDVNASLVAINADLEQQHVALMEQLESLRKVEVEGSYMIVLAVVIGLGIYMFWSQLSKW